MNSYRYKFWTPLANFKSGSPIITLAEGIVIRKVSEYENKEIDRLAGDWPTIMRGEFVLECTISKGIPE